ncbi:MAG: NAD(P)-dependent oxidoreductase [Lautropia sp.]
MPDAALARLDAEPDLTYEVADGPDAEQMSAGLARADILLLRATPRLTAGHVRAAPRLRVVSRYGVGYDNVAVDALTERRIPLLIVGDNNSTSVAEGTFALMIACARRLLEYDRATRAGDWRRRDSLQAGELAGKRLLVVGFGKIGRKLAARAAAFEMTVHVFDPGVPAADVRAAGAVPEADLDAALAVADFVSLHVNLSDATRRMIDADRLRRMKPHAVIINASRGGVVDEAALAQALHAGTIGGAGIDVFEHEPIRRDCLLLAAPNVILSPHAAGLTREAGDRMAIATVENALAAWRGEVDPALVVNRQVIG